VAAALERQAGPVPHAELAHHALRGPPEMLPRAVDHAVAFARRAQELCAYHDAVETLERARDAVAAAHDPPALRARVLVALGEALIRRGDSVAGQACCREAATLARALGNAELGAQAALTYGRVFTFAKVDPVLVGMLEESLEALPPGDSALRARLLARLGAALQPNPRTEEPLALAREAIATARRIGDQVTLLEVLHDAISASMDVVDPAEQRALNLEAEELALALGDRERLLRTLGRLALAHLALGELAAADTRIAAFEALAAELKAPSYAWRGFMLRAVRATMHGRFAEAEQLADQALRCGQEAGDVTVETIWISNREGLLRAAERHDEMATFEPRVRRSRATYNHAPGWQNAGAALTHARREDLENARLYLDLMPNDYRPPADNLFASFFMVEPVALTGLRQPAELLYARLAALPDQYVMLGMSYMSWEGPVARLRGLLAASLGRWDEAWKHFEEAEARCRRLEARPYLARTEYEHGRARLARGAAGDRALARGLIGSARATAEELGMAGLVALADRRLAEIGTAEVGTAAPSAAPAAPAGGDGSPAFTLEGEYWTVTYEGATFRLKDSLGLQYLVRLLEQPGREVHVLDLVGERAGGGANEAVDAGDAGEHLDAEARATYKRRLEDLRESLAEAESFGDAARAARARAEIEFLAAELGRAVGLGGRARRAGAAAERARSAVQRRIKNALERIAEHAPALAAYLGRTIKTGNFCVFRP
jgi:tetratricopeptide (TPR) repeat protein